MTRRWKAVDKLQAFEGKRLDMYESSLCRQTDLTSKQGGKKSLTGAHLTGGVASDEGKVG